MNESVSCASAGAGAASVLLVLAEPALAQQLQLPAFLQPGEKTDGQTAGYIVQLFGLLTVLSLAPGILISVTSFTRFIVVFSIMRSGLGLQTTPANLILVSLALFMTWYVMNPVVDRAWNDGLGPMMRNEISQEEGFRRTAEPFRRFMLANVRDTDLRLFADLSPRSGQESARRGALPSRFRRSRKPTAMIPSWALVPRSNRSSMPMPRSPEKMTAKRWPTAFSFPPS